MARAGVADDLTPVDEAINFEGSTTPEVLESLISVRLRQELQIFASKALRQELSNLRSKVRSDIREELESVLDEHRDGFSNSHFSLHKGNTGTASNGTTPKESWSANNLIDVTDIRPHRVVSVKKGNRGKTGSGIGPLMHQLKTLVSDTSFTKKEDKQDLRDTRETRFSESSSNELNVLPKESVMSVWLTEEAAQANEERKKKSGMKHTSRRKMRTQRTGRALVSVVKAPEGSWLAKVCQFIATILEQSVIVVIFLNGVFIGVQTEYQAQQVTESVPSFFPVMEMFFCVVFTSELLLKLIAYRRRFFTMKDWQWNVFDTFLVFIQLLEIIGMMTTNHESTSGGGGGGSGSSSGPVQNVSFLRLLRILRLFRVLRLVRLLHFVGELATIVSSIANSFRALCWTVVLLVLMIYMVGIFYTQIVFSHRVANKGTEGDAVLDRWWGSLGRSILSLYQAILGGVDWEDIVTPLEEEIHPLLSLSFCFYIAFALLAMMNIITGTFVQSALNNAESEKTQDFVTAAHDVFTSVGQTGLITKEQFEYEIDDDHFRSYIQNIGIDPKDAKLLFRLLDSGQADAIELEMLIAGMVRLREGAKFMDILKLMNETERTGRKLDETCMHLESILQANMPQITELTEQIRQQSQYHEVVAGGVSNSVQKINGIGREHNSGYEQGLFQRPQERKNLPVPGTPQSLPGTIHIEEMPGMMHIEEVPDMIHVEDM